MECTALLHMYKSCVITPLSTWLHKICAFSFSPQLLLPPRWIQLGICSSEWMPHDPLMCLTTEILTCLQVVDLRTLYNKPIHTQIRKQIMQCKVHNWIYVPHVGSTDQIVHYIAIHSSTIYCICRMKLHKAASSSSYFFVMSVQGAPTYNLSLLRPTRLLCSRWPSSVRPLVPRRLNSLKAPQQEKSVLDEDPEEEMQVVGEDAEVSVLKL